MHTGRSKSGKNIKNLDLIEDEANTLTPFSFAPSQNTCKSAGAKTHHPKKKKAPFTDRAFQAPPCKSEKKHLAEKGMFPRRQQCSRDEAVSAWICAVTL